MFHSSERDRAALGKTRFALLPQWSNALGGPLSSWDGVEVNKEGRVVKLDLHGKQVKSLFPTEVCELDALKELVLHTNRLTGCLPAKLGDLSALEKLDVWDNFLEGPIPTSLAKLSALVELHLSGNFLSGPVPRELGSLGNLRELYLHGNKLSGEIPRALGDLSRLQKLVLINNRLTGPIPAELGKLKVIVEINLANNRLSGPIPAKLGQLSNLTKLILWGNNLSGSIPEELGELALLEKLDLAQNALLMSGGGIPLSLRNHRNFKRFVFAVPEDGAPIPPWRSKRSLLPAVVLGYLDLFTDIAVVFSYWMSDAFPWFRVWVAFIVGAAFIVGGFIWREENIWRGAAAAAQLGLLVEGYVSVKEEAYSHSLVAIRVLESLFQSLPLVVLQPFVLLVEREHLALRVLSMAVSTLSLATTSTGILVEHPLSQLRWARGVPYPNAKLLRASRLLFGTVPYVGSVHVRMGFRIHPQDFVWWFLSYQIMEIVSRVLSLAVVTLALGYYVFVLLAWLFLSRSFIARVSVGGSPVVRERLLFRRIIRFAASPIMDSVIDRVMAYKTCCFMTCLETVCFLIVGNVMTSPDVEGALESDLARRVYSVVSLVFMGGKIALATAVVVPFKAKIGEDVPPVNGELRVGVEEEGTQDGGGGNNRNKHSTNRECAASVATTTRETRSGVGKAADCSGVGSRADPSAQGEEGDSGISMDAIMAAVDGGVDPTTSGRGALDKVQQPESGERRREREGVTGMDIESGGDGNNNDAGRIGSWSDDDDHGRQAAARGRAPGGGSYSGGGGGGGRFTPAGEGGVSARASFLQTVEEGDRGQGSWADGDVSGCSAARCSYSDCKEDDIEEHSLSFARAPSK